MKRETLERIDACLEGTLDPAGFDELQRELRDDPAALAHYCHQAALHGRLEWELGEPAQTLIRESSRPVLAPAQARTRLPRFAMAAAALVLLVLGISLWPQDRSAPVAVAPIEPPPAEEPDYVARITRSADAVWKSQAIQAGDYLQPGTLELAAGSAEVTFDCGASVLLQGGSSLILTSATRARLESGKATVEIPREARGFIFETPSTLLSEHNSRFGVAVDGDGSAEIHVLEGRVELNGKWGDLASLMLGKNKPVRVNREGILLAGERYRPDQFPVRPPAGPELLPEWFLHWSFDSAATSRETFRESGHRPPGMPVFPAEVRLNEEKASVGLIPGRFGNAVQLNGEDAFLATGFPGIAGHAPRSVAFWIRLPANSSEIFAYSILSWGSPTPGNKWQIGWNTGTDSRGTRGAIRTEVQGGYKVGSTNLLDGRWHHVAIVFLGGPGAATDSHIRHYVDGRLEQTTAVKSHPISTGTSGPKALPLSIGRRIESDTHFRTFKGDLDELYILPTALTPEQIQVLFLENRPPTVR
ncbi:MAG: FecR domain-containing protein [Akkermansiaceae bacterium]|jgi:ferric-dicitrate binding protein FerR (iron transport regulator)|nr:FecR domain-containing protein [Akkermansiaceae bacterium]